MRRDVAVGRIDRGLYGGDSVLGAGMWQEEGETEDSMVDAMYQDSGCGLR